MQTWDACGRSLTMRHCFMRKTRFLRRQWLGGLAEKAPCKGTKISTVEGHLAPGSVAPEHPGRLEGGTLGT
jgi:hypothetical protein